MQLRILIHAQFENKGSRANRVKRKLVRRDRLPKIVNHGRSFDKFVHDNTVYIRRREEDISRFQVCQMVRPVNTNGREYVGCTGMNDLAFIVQILQAFQNVFRQV